MLIRPNYSNQNDKHIEVTTKNQRNTPISFIYEYGTKT